MQRVLVLSEQLVREFYTKRLFPLMDAVTCAERELQQMLLQPNVSSGASSLSSSPEPHGEQQQQKSRRVSRTGRISAARRKLLGGGGCADDEGGPPRPSDIGAFWRELGLRPDEWRQLACKILDDMFGAGFFQPVCVMSSANSEYA